MKFVYPKHKENLDEVDYAVSYGNYPLSTFNSWHGGVHRENMRAPLVAISDARVIAYRIPAEYLATSHATPEIYSNGFVLLQHFYQSPEGQELTFYSLYHHVASKAEIDNPEYRMTPPRFLSKPTATVKSSDEPMGVRGRSPVAAPGATRGVEVALVPKNFLLFRNGDELLAPWAATYNATRSADRSQYHSYAYTDPFSGTSYADLHIHGSTVTKVEGTANQYRVSYDSDGNTTSGGSTTAALYADLQPGALLYDVPDDWSGEAGNGFAIGVIPKDTEVTLIADAEHTDSKWSRVEGHNGYVELAKLEENSAWKDDLQVDTVVGCDHPVAADEIVAYVGKFGFERFEEKPTSHLELFTDAADGEVNNFLTNAKNDGADSHYNYIISASTTLEPYVKSNQEIPAGTTVEVKEILGEYARVRVQATVRTVENLRDIAVDKVNNVYVEEDVAGESRIRYSIVPERFAHVNALFNGQLTPGAKVYLYEMLAGNARKVTIDTPLGGKEFWIDAAPTGGAAAGTQTDLPSAACCIYIGRPYPEPENGNTLAEDRELKSYPEEKVTDDDGVEWLFIAMGYECDGTCYDHVGWLNSEDPNLKQLNPFDWTAFGFKKFDAGSEYVYTLQDYLEAPDTHAFVQEVWEMADADGDKVLTPMELLNAQRNPPTADRMGRMVVKHKNEWSYTPGEIRTEAMEFFAPGIEKEEDPDRKAALEAERDAQLDPLVDKLGNLMIWDEIQAAPFTPEPEEEDQEYEAEKQRIKDYYASTEYRIYYPADSQEAEATDLDNLDRKYEKGAYATAADVGRILPSSPQVWHWNIHNFVRQMRMMFGNKCKYLQKGDKNELVRELNIRLAGFGGNVPTDEFTDRTEAMVKQFQKDYMEVEETGLVCGGVFTAIDKFESEYDFNFNQLRCRCGVCPGYGRGWYSAERGDAGIRERFRKYEYPGIHRTLIYVLKAMMFYMDKDTTHNLAFYHITSGYRCHEDNRQHAPRSSTNHMGKAIDIQLSQNGRFGNTETTANLGRDEFMIPLHGAQLRWGGSNKVSLEPGKKDRRGGEFIARTWVHYDVREFDVEYLDDRYFKKTKVDLIGPKMVDLAEEAEYTIECDCSNSGGENTGQAREETATDDERVDINTLSLSEQGKTFIKDWEQFRSTPYNDTEGYCTVGYGHLIARRRCANITLPTEFQQPITRQRASELFEQRLVEFEASVKRDINVPLKQNEYDALVSLVFNTGPNFLTKGGANKGPTMIMTNINQGLYAEGAEEFRDVTNGGEGGLVTRRGQEIQMFLNKNYDSTH